MVKIYITAFLILLSLFSLAQTSDDKELKETYKELIIGVPKVSEKNLYLITNTINEYKGLQFVMFCPKDCIVLVKYDPRDFEKTGDILDIFKEKNINMPMFIKEGSFKDVIDDCQENKGGQ